MYTGGNVADGDIFGIPAAIGNWDMPPAGDM